ncbi:hypothetical protein [Gryllotalpicola koreensis]|uniref:DUF4355 domain-containing protein n=1 Tax=Gryllotalpicola koreensis TaxID=993086 RepID=A0ABP8A2W5_9MICO
MHRNAFGQLVNRNLRTLAPEDGDLGGGSDPVDVAPAATDAQADATPDTDQVPADDDWKSDPARVDAALKRLRDENAKLRTGNKDAAQKAIDDAVAKARADAAAEQAQTIGKALGLIKDDEPADPSKLIEQLTQERDSIKTERDALAKQRAARTEEDAIRAAAKTHGADLDLVTPYLKGTGALTALDQNADDYAEQVSALVKATVDKNPKLREVLVASQSTGDAPTTGDQTPEPEDDIEAQRKRYRKERGYTF